MTTFMLQYIYTTINHSVDHIDLPLTDKRMELVGDDVGDRGRDCIQICFDPEEQNKQFGARDPRVSNGEEQKVGASPPCTPASLDYCREGSIWTPPYCPDLQPC
jgi:hypothetical protein